MSPIKKQRSRRPYSHPAYGNVALVQYGSGKPDCGVGDPTERRQWADPNHAFELKTNDAALQLLVEKEPKVEPSQ
ncbi:MAG: hypothetical protein OSA52_13045 [Yoonia sp.]|nr:hypothetical protein [Yoonia sp.]